MWKFLCLFGCLLLFQNISGTEYIKIGGIFDEDDEVELKVFEYVINSINNETILIPDSVLVGIPKKIKDGNSFQALNAACDLLQEGAIGIFGPLDNDASSIVSSISEAKNVLHVEFDDDNDDDDKEDSKNCDINFYPHPTALSEVYRILINTYDWESFAVLYDDSESLITLGDFVNSSDEDDDDDDDTVYDITFFKLDEADENNYRDVLYKVVESGEKNIFLDCSIDILDDVLIQAQQVGMMTSEYNYIMTNLDAHTIDLDPFRYAGTNIIGMRMVDPEDPLVIETVQYWNSLYSQEEENGDDSKDLITPEKLTLETALLADAIYSFASVLDEVDFSNLTSEGIDCDDDDSQLFACNITNSILEQKDMKGLTGEIAFDEDGLRVNFTIGIYKLIKTGDVVIDKFMDYNHGAFQVSEEKSNDSNDEIITVLMTLNKPYVMMRDPEMFEGNELFEGFAVDIIEELSEILGFEYKFELQEDGKIGSEHENGTWDGMIGEILNETADLAISDLTITSERQSVVDFSAPFMYVDIIGIHQKYPVESNDLYSFLTPFSTGLWISLAVAYVVMSILIFVLARISPKEWKPPHSCKRKPKKLENQFNICNSIWFTVANGFQQGSEYAPTAVSTRMLTVIWWSFTLLIIAFYIAGAVANLSWAAYLDIFSVKGFECNSGLMYGAKLGGSTLNFLKNSDDTAYKQIYECMIENPDLLVRSTEEGINRVREEEDYAFLTESTTIEYILNHACDLGQNMKIPYERGYGIAMKKDFQYRNALSTAILRMHENGMLTSLKNKWWDSDTCEDDVEDSIFVENLDISNISGIFLLLIFGGIIAFFVALGEMTWGVIKRSRESKVPFFKELLEELKFVINVTNTKKPVKRKPSPKTPEGTTNGNFPEDKFINETSI